MGYNKAQGDQVPATEFNSFLASAGLYAASSAGSDTYAITVTPTPNDYDSGDRYTFKADVANTGACTLNVNGLGAKTIKKFVSSDLETGDILAGQVVTVKYDGTNFQMELSTRRPVTAVTIASGSLPAAATLDITSIPATYLYLVLVLTGVSSATGAREPIVQVDTDNGASFDTTAGNYIGNKYISSAPQTLIAADLASIVQSDDIASAGHTANMFLKIMDYQGLGMRPKAEAITLNVDIGTHHASEVYYVGSVAAINAIRILWNGSGNFDAGTYALYGIG